MKSSASEVEENRLWMRSALYGFQGYDINVVTKPYNGAWMLHGM